MNEKSPNSYLQRYELKEQAKESRSQSKPSIKQALPAHNENIEPNTIGMVVSKLSERVEGIDIKLTSIVNVVKLLQRYTQTLDNQYEKQKQNQFSNKGSGVETCSSHCYQIENRIKEFDILSKQFKEQMKTIERMKGNLVITQLRGLKQESSVQNSFAEEMEQRLRDEINKKMEICVKLINSTSLLNANKASQKQLNERINEVSFSLNQLENDCKKNKMVFEKDIDFLTEIVKQNSTQIPKNHSRITDKQINSRSPIKPPLERSRSKNSKSDKSISKNKQNRSAVMVNIPKQISKIRQDELKQALRKKKQNRQKLKSKNL